MSELLEVDYGGEDIQNEIRNQNLKTEIEINSNQDKKEENKNDIELHNQKKISEKLNKEPIFFVMKISEELLISSLSANELTLSEDVFKSYEKYFEVIIKDL